MSVLPRMDLEFSTHSNMVTRVESLKRDIKFLQREHLTTLEKLHGEIDFLKRENKELQYKLIMALPMACSKVTVKRPLAQTDDQVQTGISLEEVLPSQEPGFRSVTENGESAHAPTDTSRSTRAEQAVRRGLVTSLHLQPPMIPSGFTQPPRAATLHECELIIRQLYHTNSLQSQEIQRVKAVLQDIVFNKKISPENYIRTKPYLPDGSRVEGKERFPKVAFQPLPKRVHAAQVLVTDRVILPALKQSLRSSITERQKGSQALQKSRLKRTAQ